MDRSVFRQLVELQSKRFSPVGIFDTIQTNEYSPSPKLLFYGGHKAIKPFQRVHERREVVRKRKRQSGIFELLTVAAAQPRRHSRKMFNEMICLNYSNILLPFAFTDTAICSPTANINSEVGFFSVLFLRFFFFVQNLVSFFYFMVLLL